MDRMEATGGWPVADGEMATRIRTFDWSTTPLGPFANWPQSLKTTVDNMLGSGHAMMLAWGPDRTILYNDAYAPMMGDRDPGGLGLPLRNAWPDVWDEIAPLVEKALAGDTVRFKNMPLTTTRHGTAEQSWWTFSYSPVRNEADEIVGLLNVTVDTTAQVRAETALRESEARHRLLLASLAQATWEVDPEGVVVADSPSWRAYTGQTVEEWLGYGWLNAIHPDDRAHVERQWREAMVARRDVDAELRFRAPHGSWRWTNVRAAPVLDADGSIEKWVGMNIDIDARKRAEAALRESEERQAFQLQLSDALAPLIDPVEIQAEAMRLLAQRLDASWCYFNEFDERGTHAIVLRDFHRDHLPSMMGVHDLSAERRFLDLVHSGTAFSFSDWESFEHFSAPAAAAFQAFGMRAAMGAPLLRNGRLVAVLLAADTRARSWSQGETELLEGAAERTWIALQRARTEQASRESEERQAFVLQLSDTLRPLAGSTNIQGETTRLLREQLNAGWCYYVDWDLDRSVGLILRDSARDGLPSLVGAHDVSDAQEFLHLLADGTVRTVSDYANYEQLPARTRQNFVGLGFRSMMMAPLVKEGRLIATLLVGDTEVRDWSASETSLLVEAAERTWAALERARAEAALRESEERFQEFANASAFGLWIRDAGTFAMEYTSPAIAGIYGVGSDALLGDVSRWAGMIHPEDRNVARQHLEKARTGELITHEFRIRRASDQAIRWIRNTDFPLYDGEHIQRIGGIAEDITEAKAIQQELEHGAERLRNAIEVGRVGLWDWNTVTGDVHWSDEHFRLQEYAVGEVAPSYETWASRIHPDDRAGAEAALHQAMADHQEYAQEFRAVHPDGSVHWHSARGRFFYDDRGEATRMIGAMVDTTERREWEERQKVLVAELQHRTRNLMGVVRSMSDKTARASADLPDFRARFRDRLEALSRVQGLLSRLEDHDRVTFDDLIRTELAAMNGNSERAVLSGPRGIRLRSSTVQTLAMALHELATNAMKYGALGQPAGRLAIAWSLEHDGESDKPWLHIDWRESGVAMATPGVAPKGTGQGRELIEKALPYQLKAKTSYTLGSDGVHCTISIPVSIGSGDAEDHG